MKTIFRHLGSFTAPIVLCFVVPFVIIWVESQHFTRPVWTPAPGLRMLGGAISTAGLIMIVLTIRIFILVGRGTIMPWDPTRNLIIAGPYRHVRNPMIMSVIAIQVGEAILFASPGILVLALLNFVINMIYFIASEEPGLEKRFGGEYLEYKKNVPRWLPRLKPWRPN